MAAKKPVEVAINPDQSDETRFALLKQAIGQISQDVCDVDVKADETNDKLDAVIAKLDTALTNKADRSEVVELTTLLGKKANEEDFKELRKLLIGVLLSIAGFAIVTLIGIVMFRIGLNS